LGSKSKKQNRVKSKNSKQAKIPERNMFIIPICALLFFPAFFRGLFFERELIVVHITSFILVLVWIAINRRDETLPIIRYKYEYLLFAAVAMYIITVPFAAGRRLAMSEALKYANYLAVYVLVRDQVTVNKNACRTFINAMLASIFIMCVIGLLNYAGLMETHGALISDRISSTLQYPNTLAAVIGAAVFLNLYLVLETESIRMKSIYISVLNILITAFVLTFSRTMYVMFPVLLIVFFIMVPSRLKGGIMAAVFASAVPSLAAAVLLVKYKGVSSAVSIIVLLLSVLLSSVLLHLFQRIKLSFVFTRVHKYIAVGLVLAAVIPGVFVLTETQPLELSHHNTEDGNISRSKAVYSIEGEGDYLLVLDAAARQNEEKPWLGRVAVNSVDRAYRSSRIKNHYIREETDGTVEIPFSTDADTYYVTITFYNHYNDTSFTIRDARIIDQAGGVKPAGIKLNYKYMPQALVSRIESMNPKNNSLQGRIAFFRDAFSIIKDNPLFGLGGGAWQAAYLKYRSYEYWTTQTHSYPIQVWMEIGTIGLLLVAGFVVFYIINIVKAFKNIATDSGKLQLVATAFFALGILAHSLVDFDLSLGAVSIMLWASLALVSVYFMKQEARGTDKHIRKVFSAALIVLLGITASLGVANSYTIQTARAADQDRYRDAEKSAKVAVRLDPLNPTLRRNLASVIGASKHMDNDEKYLRINEQWEAAIKHDPYNYELYRQMTLHQARYGNYDGALQYIDKAIMNNPAAPDVYLQKFDLLYNTAKYYYEQADRDKAAGVLERLRGIEGEMADNNRKLSRPIKVDPGLLAYYYNAGFILDNMNNKNIFNIANRVVLYEVFSFDTDGDLLPDLWQIPYQEDKAINGQIEKRDEAGAFILTSDNPSFYIQRMNMDLDPSREYLLMIEGYSRSPEGEMRVMIRSGNGTAGQYDDGYFTFNQESSVYETTFETTGDIKAGSQYIRLYFRDIEDEVVLKRITLMRID